MNRIGYWTCLGAKASLLLRKALNIFLDKLVHPEINPLHRHLSAYQGCGYIGFVLAVLLAMILTFYRDLSPWAMVGVVGIAVLTFLGMAMAAKIINGEEQLIYYHHEIAVIIMATILLKIMDQPILPYLDITVLGIGAFLICGRVGCLMVGCCHGRPYKWGVCYLKEHVDAGFTHYYEGVRLFPIQAVESMWVFFVVVIGVVFVLTKKIPGHALALYVINYGIGRFIFEFARGDPGRSYYWGFSEGQWISVILMIAIVWGEMSGMLPFHLWHIIATAGIVLTMIAIAIVRQSDITGKHQLLNPYHVREIAEAIDRVSSMVSERPINTGGHIVPEVVHMSSTSLGIQISAGKIKDADTSIDHYALSSQNGTMSEEAARRVADLIIQMKHLSGANRLILGGNGVFHLLVHSLSAGDQG